ncbi:MAG: hypothetical protein ACFB6R_12200 [Alphaproteobacteria bacterium]
MADRPDGEHRSGDTGAGGERHWWRASRMPFGRRAGWRLAVTFVTLTVLALSAFAIIFTLAAGR